MEERKITVYKGSTKDYTPVPRITLQGQWLAGIAGAVIIRAGVYFRGKNAKKYRHGVEYGSARWGRRRKAQTSRQGRKRRKFHRKMGKAITVTVIILFLAVIDGQNEVKKFQQYGTQSFKCEI